MINYSNNILLKVILSCLLVMAQASLEQRIPSRTEEVPFLVKIGNKEFFYCSGSLVTKLHVLTAATCVYDKKPQQIFVKVGGTSNRTDPGIISTVSNYKIHNDFNITTYDADVAVLKLTTPITSIPVGPVNLNPLTPGDKLKVVWSAIEEQEPVQLTGAIEVLDMDICLKKYKFKNSATQTMFCAREMNINKLVDLSVGGPVLRNGGIAGIVLDDIGCTRRDNYTTVYTNVRAVVAFISNSLGKL